jgi:hypothetical protein
VAGEEGGERFGEGARLLQHQQVAGAWERERLGAREPGEQALLALGENWRALLAGHDQDRADDPSRVLGAKAPR